MRRPSIACLPASQVVEHNNDPTGDVVLRAEPIAIGMQAEHRPVAPEEERRHVPDYRRVTVLCSVLTHQDKRQAGRYRGQSPGPHARTARPGARRQTRPSFFPTGRPINGGRQAGNDNAPLVAICRATR